MWARSGTGSRYIPVVEAARSGKLQYGKKDPLEKDPLLGIYSGGRGVGRFHGTFSISPRQFTGLGSVGQFKICRIFAHVNRHFLGSLASEIE